ncbi:11703_t:CDS:2 [Entrophospora sp. SA101]|nr:11703_t:CDS:2 [Entrophospora sp. SA101]
MEKEITIDEIENAVRTCGLNKIINFIGETDAPHDTSHMIMYTCKDESVAGGIHESASLISELNLTAKGNFKFSKLEQITTEHQGFYCYPSIHSFESIDALIPGTKSSSHRLFQMTVSNSHPIKQDGINKVIKYLNELQNETKEAELYFAVPGEIYLTFNKQKFQTKQGKDAGRTPQIVYSIKQYSFKIPLDGFLKL